jgi:predicted methyltransferase
MSAAFTADDLRAIADVLDRMTDITRRTGVLLHGYDDAHITHHDHVMRVRWLGGGDSNDRYVLDVPDKDY